MDNNVAARADIEAIGVVTTSAVTGLVVNGHAGDGQSIAAVDANGLYGGVLDVEVVDTGRASQAVSGEELGLDLALVTFAVPPAGTVAVELGTAGTGDGDILALNLQQRALPLLVAPSSGAFEDDLKIETK